MSDYDDRGKPPPTGLAVPRLASNPTPSPNVPADIRDPALFYPEEFFPKHLLCKASDISRPNFDGLRKVKAAIDEYREKNRKKQHRSREKRGAFAGDDKATVSPECMSGATADTLLVYMYRGQALCARYKHEEQINASNEDIDPRDLVVWLLGVRPFWTESTWRANRIAASTLIRTIPHEGSDEALAFLDRIGRRPLYQYRPSTLAGVDASSARRMDYKHFEKIRRTLPLLPHRNKACSWLNDWLVAGLSTGLAPDEWMLTEIEPDKTGEHIWLHVVDSHAAEMGLRGSYRTIDLCNFSAEACEAVVKTADRARQWTLAGSFAQRKSELSGLLGVTSKTLFRRTKLRYDLESLQHQCIANMTTIYTREHVSALIGALFIGDKSNRHQPWDSENIIQIPIPLEDDVQRFRRMIAIFETRRELRKLRGK
jgi:hypothetical protein